MLNHVATHDVFCGACCRLCCRTCGTDPNADGIAAWEWACTTCGVCIRQVRWCLWCLWCCVPDVDVDAPTLAGLPLAAHNPTRRPHSRVTLLTFTPGVPRLRWLLACSGATGKTEVVSSVMKELGLEHAWVNCLEGQCWVLRAKCCTVALHGRSCCGVAQCCAPRRPSTHTLSWHGYSCRLMTTLHGTSHPPS